eukprot:486279-Pleurochrysis_carterae.AAC.1
MARAGDPGGGLACGKGPYKLDGVNVCEREAARFDSRGSCASNGWEKWCGGVLSGFDDSERASERLARNGDDYIRESERTHAAERARWPHAAQVGNGGWRAGGRLVRADARTSRLTPPCCTALARSSLWLTLCRLAYVEPFLTKKWSTLAANGRLDLPFWPCNRATPVLE